MKKIISFDDTNWLEEFLETCDPSFFTELAASPPPEDRRAAACSAPRPKRPLEEEGASARKSKVPRQEFPTNLPGADVFQTAFEQWRTENPAGKIGAFLQNLGPKGKNKILNNFSLTEIQKDEWRAYFRAENNKQTAGRARAKQRDEKATISHEFDALLTAIAVQLSLIGGRLLSPEKAAQLVRLKNRIESIKSGNLETESLSSESDADFDSDPFKNLDEAERDFFDEQYFRASQGINLSMREWVVNSEPTYFSDLEREFKTKFPASQTNLKTIRRQCQWATYSQTARENRRQEMQNLELKLAELRKVKEQLDSF